jgi:hypothetical protein
LGLKTKAFLFKRQPARTIQYRLPPIEATVKQVVLMTFSDSILKPGKIFSGIGKTSQMASL